MDNEAFVFSNRNTAATVIKSRPQNGAERESISDVLQPTPDREFPQLGQSLLTQRRPFFVAQSRIQLQNLCKSPLHHL